MKILFKIIKFFIAYDSNYKISGTFSLLFQLLCIYHTLKYFYSYRIYNIVVCKSNLSTSGLSISKQRCSHSTKTFY